MSNFLSIIGLIFMYLFLLANRMANGAVYVLTKKKDFFGKMKDPLDFDA